MVGDEKVGGKVIAVGGGGIMCVLQFEIRLKSSVMRAHPYKDLKITSSSSIL